MVSHSDIVIEAQNIHKNFRIGSEEVHALKGVDLKIPRGHICGVTGRSGSGKSTLLHILGTLDQPSSGSLRINDRDPGRMSDMDVSQFRNRTVGFVFQMNNLLPEFSAVENVIMPGLIAQGDRKQLTARAHELIAAVGLDHRRNHRPGELSGGEQQRVAIARSLLMAPSILLADEPTGNLDRQSSKAVVDLLLGLCDASGITMLLVTHDQNLANELPHQIIMEDGMILNLGGSW